MSLLIEFRELNFGYCYDYYYYYWVFGPLFPVHLSCEFPVDWKIKELMFG